jgi:branched-chain amino acid transport system ATP-binding protein
MTQPGHNANAAVAPAEREPLLEAERLSVGYGPVPVIRDLSLTVRPGEILAVIGPNGAGKTSLLRGLAGALHPLDGQVRWGGRPTSAPMHRRCRDGLSYVTEERSVIASLSARDNLKLGCRDIEDALTIMPELRPVLSRQAGLLSGGEQQMLTLARALARRPRVLLADELSLGLAPMIARRLLAAIRVATEQGLGAVIVEQKVAEVLEFADRAIVLRQGEIVLSGSAHDLLDRLDEVEAAYLSGLAGDAARGGAAAAD